MLAQRGLLFKGSHANLSARLGSDQMVMTRGGSVAGLTSDGLAVLGLDGTVLEGEMTAVNREVIDMHTAIYRARPEVGSVIHVHAPNLTTFAVANQSLPVIYEPMLRFGIETAIPVVPWAPRGSAESVNGIIEEIRRHPHLPAVLLANHGVVAFYASPGETAELLSTLEEAAELALGAGLIGGARPMPDQALIAVRERMRQFSHQHQA